MEIVISCIVGIIFGSLITRFLFIKRYCRGDIVVMGNSSFGVELNTEDDFEKLGLHPYVVLKVRKKN